VGAQEVVGTGQWQAEYWTGTPNFRAYFLPCGFSNVPQRNTPGGLALPSEALLSTDEPRSLGSAAILSPEFLVPGVFVVSQKMDGLDFARSRSWAKTP